MPILDPLSAASTGRRVAALALLVVALSAVPVGTEASCNLGVRARASFEGEQGALNRPFAAPGELLEVSLRSCDASPGLSSNPLDHAVTVIFAPDGGPRTAVVLTADAIASPGRSCQSPWKSATVSRGWSAVPMAMMTAKAPIVASV